MSFFIDVWTNHGFILASDVRYIINNQYSHIHKLTHSSHHSDVPCAIAVCGDYPELCINYFIESTIRLTLKEIAYNFAKLWTNRFGGISEYSAVHLVGFEKIPNTNKYVPQMWFWCNWKGPGENDYYDFETLNNNLESFSNPVPKNNHIPWKIFEIEGTYPAHTLIEEYHTVNLFLSKHPYFSWNGDNSVWRSAAQAVGSAINIFSSKRLNLSFDYIEKITIACMEFIIKICDILPNTTISASPSGEFDVLKVTPDKVIKVNWSKLEQ